MMQFVVAPRISAAQFARVLTRAQSPAAEAAAELYAIVAGADLDPAIALAFFAHESTYGKYGVARRSRNWGNLRRGARAYAIEGGFGFYHSWADSLRDWCDLIRERYVARGLNTVEAAIPVYAPSSDGNAPARYIAQVRQLVAAWQAAEQAEPRYRVAVDGARVRAGAGRGFAIVGRLGVQSDPVTGTVVMGEAVDGEARWLQLGPQRYIHLGLLRPA